MNYMIITMLYVLVGVLLSALTTVSDTDGNLLEPLREVRAITKPAYLVMFIIAWPLIVVYMGYMIYNHGTLKYKGKVIWQAKRLRGIVEMGPGWYILTGNEYMAGPFGQQVDAEKVKKDSEIPGRVAYLALGRFDPKRGLAS